MTAAPRGRGHARDGSAAGDPAPGVSGHGGSGRGADSAGHPWSGRTFDHHDTAHAGDDGSGDPRLLDALLGFREGRLGESDVVDALRPARLLVPLVAVAGDEGLDERGRRVDKTQELSIVTVSGPDGRDVLPAFTSVETMTRWRPAARPVPVEARRVALAAASESTDHIVIDPGSITEFGLRRPAVWAIAQDLPWTPSHHDEHVLGAFLDASRDEEALVSLVVAPGYRDARLGAPEIVVQLGIVPGLDRDALAALVGRLQAAWAADPLIVDRVDSMSVKVVAG